MRQLVITASITRRDEKSLQRYLTEIASHDVLTPEQELELFHRYKAGDEEAFQSIIQHNLRFVVSVAKQYQHTGLWLGDLISEGNIGLIKAARRFDETRGFKFISYAVWWIRQSILQAINVRGRKIRVPANQIGLKYKLRRAKEHFLQTHERTPTVEELAEITDNTPDMIARSERIANKCRSLDAPLSEDGDATLVEVTADEAMREPDFAVAVRESQQKEVEQLLEQVSPREATILSMYYGIDSEYPMSLNDISDHIGISQERIRQIRDKSIKKLRRRFQPHMEATFAH
ncbi:MAG: RNA polymerase sigma factor RpoD/SigA [Saprospiraceae bacterium]|nr:RNA polymerase sigma factor RpoD/SigA [Saprospiraceae bacterium]